ncbi:MAG TPA: glycosyltransferase family 1 protein [Bryobacteraceae bacterium]|nr:glycosyltransferase family 1 protein [Bryobacteraceae bacterium]
MHIALDGTPLSVPSGGVRRYTEELSKALAQEFSGDEFWLLSDQPFELPAALPLNLKIGGRPRSLLDRRWWLWGLQKETSRLKIQVFHGTDFAVPYLPVCASVMTLHDLSPWMEPAWHNQSDRVRNRTPILLRLGLATMVITPSEAIRSQAIDRFRLNPSRVVAVPLAAGPSFRQQTPDRGTNEPPYLLYIGTIEPRKNVPMLLEIWHEIRRDHGIDLVIAGRRRSDAAEIAPEPGLHVLGLTSEEQLPRLISGAFAFLYPSYYEGFGLPVLEAMQCGAAVIASRDPAIAEVAGDGAMLLDPSDARAWVETVRAILADPCRVHELRARALKRASEFSWAKTARRTRQVYEQALQRFRHKT